MGEDVAPSHQAPAASGPNSLYKAEGAREDIDSSQIWEADCRKRLFRARTDGTLLTRVAEGEEDAEADCIEHAPVSTRPAVARASWLGGLLKVSGELVDDAVLRLNSTL